MVMSSVVMFMVVISTAFASRYEGATLLQTQEFEHLQAAEGGRVEHLATMKQQILSFAETGVPANTLPLLATIKSTLEDDILPTILNETTQHNILHDRLKSAFSNAAATYNTEITDLGTVEGAAATAAKNEHTSCRVQEGVDWQQTSDCDVQQETAQGEYDTDETMLKRKVEQAAGVCVDNGYDWRNTADLNAHETNLQHYKDAVTALKGSRTVLETKIRECEGLEVERGTQQSLCDGKQTSYEESACTLSLGHQAANAAYTVTYETSKGLFEDEFDTWQEQSIDRENQCKLVKTLVCYITALEDHDDKAALNDAVNTCEDNRDGHDCSSVTFTHEDTPAPITLTGAPVAPCDEQFDYGAFPTGTAKDECAPCSGASGGGGAPVSTEICGPEEFDSQCDILNSDGRRDSKCNRDIPWHIDTCEFESPRDRYVLFKTPFGPGTPLKGVQCHVRTTRTKHYDRLGFVLIKAGATVIRDNSWNTGVAQDTVEPAGVCTFFVNGYGPTVAAWTDGQGFRSLGTVPGFTIDSRPPSLDFSIEVHEDGLEVWVNEGGKEYRGNPFLGQMQQWGQEFDPNQAYQIAFMGDYGSGLLKCDYIPA